MNPATAPLETDAADLGYRSEPAVTARPESAPVTTPGPELLSDPGRVTPPADVVAVTAPSQPEPTAAPDMGAAVASASVLPPADTAELPTAPNELEEFVYGQRS